MEPPPLESSAISIALSRSSLGLLCQKWRTSPKNQRKNYSGCNLRTNLSEVALDAEECCWRGINNMVEIRKNRKEESLRKKLLQNAFAVQSDTSSVEKNV
ncbi:unnamed protein product [Coffea canephora]|uniref:DH200=94 genomic scaffold, scaffold_249 n=1 Tax=Coffea canephora TaxID=49390 RepID=A0A068VCR1_COFCA|nr:unnamed protein product [Coffea canephora]